MDYTILRVFFLDIYFKGVRELIYEVFVKNYYTQCIGHIIIYKLL